MNKEKIRSAANTGLGFLCYNGKIVFQLTRKQIYLVKSLKQNFILFQAWSCLYDEVRTGI